MTPRDPGAYLLVALGGGMGAALRHGANVALAGASWPRPTLVVNVVGCLAFGLLAGWFMGRVPEGPRLLVVTGVLGGFTTFSAFGGECVSLLRQRPTLAIAYALGSVLAGLVAVVVGERLAVLVRR